MHEPFYLRLLDGYSNHFNLTSSTKKRRRIKSVRDSDGSGSDTENEGRNKHGRKNIRKVKLQHFFLRIFVFIFELSIRDNHRIMYKQNSMLFMTMVKLHCNSYFFKGFLI